MKMFKMIYQDVEVSKETVIKMLDFYDNLLRIKYTQTPDFALYDTYLREDVVDDGDEAESLDDAWELLRENASVISITPTFTYFYFECGVAIFWHRFKG